MGKGLKRLTYHCMLPSNCTEYHIWWVTSPCSQNWKDICFVNVRIILWEPDTRQLMGAQRKRQIVACELFGLLKKRGGYECEARTHSSSHWSFQTNYIHATPNIKWQGNCSNEILELSGHMSESHGLDNSVTSGQFCDKNKEYQNNTGHIFI